MSTRFDRAAPVGYLSRVAKRLKRDQVDGNADPGEPADGDVRQSVGRWAGVARDDDGTWSVTSGCPLFNRITPTAFQAARIQGSPCGLSRPDAVAAAKKFDAWRQLQEQ